MIKIMHKTEKLEKLRIVEIEFVSIFSSNFLLLLLFGFYWFAFGFVALNTVIV